MIRHALYLSPAPVLLLLPKSAKDPYPRGACARHRSEEQEGLTEQEGWEQAVTLYDHETQVTSLAWISVEGKTFLASGDETSLQPQALGSLQVGGAPRPRERAARRRAAR